MRQILVFKCFFLNLGVRLLRVGVLEGSTQMINTTDPERTFGSGFYASTIESLRPLAAHWTGESWLL